MSFIRKIKRGNRIYLAEVENKREGVKVRQKVIRYLGVSPEYEKVLFPKDISELSIDSTRVFGSII